MNCYKNLLLFKLCIIIALSASNVFAQTATPTQYNAAYWNMNRAMSGVTQQALASRGYVASDPRTYGTLQGMSGAAATGFSAAASAAAGVGVVALAGTTAPAWATIALFVGVSAVVNYGVNLAIDGLVKWLFRNDNKVDESAVMSQLYSGNPFLLGDRVWRASTVAGTIYGSDGEGLARQARHIGLAASNSLQYETDITCQINTSSVSGQIWCGNYAASFLTDVASITCGAGMYTNGTTCTPYSYAQPYVIQPKTAVTVQTAVNDLPQTEMQKALSPAILAATVDALWKQAALQPGYQGFPYPSTQPVTETEAAEWHRLNPQAWPTVANFVQPRPATVTNNTALPLDTETQTAVPTTFTNVNNPAVTNSSTQPQTNFGADPATKAPILESTPTAQQILDPILNLVPSLKTFNASSNSGVCPQPSLHLFGQTQTFVAHCTIFENNRASIGAAMTFIWALLAVLIILSA